MVVLRLVAVVGFVLNQWVGEDISVHHQHTSFEDGMVVVPNLMRLGEVVAAAHQTAVVLYLDLMMLVEEAAPVLMMLVEEAAPALMTSVEEAALALMTLEEEAVVALIDLMTAREVETAVLDLTEVVGEGGVGQCCMLAQQMVVEDRTISLLMFVIAPCAPEYLCHQNIHVIAHSDLKL